MIELSVNGKAVSWLLVASFYLIPLLVGYGVIVNFIVDKMIAPLLRYLLKRLFLS